MTVLVAVPCLDMVPADFAFSLCALLHHHGQRPKPKVQLAHRKGSLIMVARNDLVAAALALPATHILFLDSDMVFPPDTLDQLLAHHVPIVGATYPKRYPPHKLMGTYPASKGLPALTRGPLVAMDYLPMGCMLIKCSVFERWGKPYFNYLQGDDTAANPTRSEDVLFCNIARSAGNTIWLDTNLTNQIGHIGMQIFRPKDTMRT